MEDSDKFGYVISTSALIVLLLSSFIAQDADSPTGTRQERSNWAKACAYEPLFLALSLSLASFSRRFPLHQPMKRVGADMKKFLSETKRAERAPTLCSRYPKRFRRRCRR